MFRSKEALLQEQTTNIPIVYGCQCNRCKSRYKDLNGPKGNQFALAYYSRHDSLISIEVITQVGLPYFSGTILMILGKGSAFCWLFRGVALIVAYYIFFYANKEYSASGTIVIPISVANVYRIKMWCTLMA